ncbi:MAG TPA: GNAT family N-acetyltransferase [Kofleriaceae bacterium]|nr:GNAT family N-acetyltransferase [Kofleriaceae bacterium]
MLPPPFHLRTGAEAELDDAIAIDTDACEAYRAIGLPFDFALEHPFAAAEVARWRASARAGLLTFACLPDGERVGFASLGTLDGRPYLDQLSVRRAYMRRGLGGALVEHAVGWSAAAGELWLTTYDRRVPWNQPWYERRGFVAVADEACGPEVRADLAHQREVLPAPDGRVAMVLRHATRPGDAPRAELRR